MNTIKITDACKGWLNLPVGRIVQAELQHYNHGQDTVWFVPELQTFVPRWAARCLDWR